ncbi:hypothetical protein [Rhodocyclus purpureus]|uniref:hypothetical protein n=1 Tax=Rhodocyclus purpureus TaxID=1067 RepID=UPI0019127E0E|nr:hypothetical protein [Rhodocyclus purpureus]MBK5915348.1 hypothetical protein [Rhodocyclus purpureus]
MSERFLVQCTADRYGRLVGRWVAALSTTGAVVAHKIERAANYDSRDAAARIAARMSKKFSGTTWEAFHA